MRLDVIVTTFNRQKLLKRALESLLAAHVPEDLSVRVTVVDNASTDQTSEVVQQIAPAFQGRLQYLVEGTQGKSYALNTGIGATTGDLVGMIDDDEEIDEAWYSRVQRAFRDEDVEFVGGPYIPRWGAEPPDWLPQNYRAAIGWIDGGDEVRPMDESYPGILMGGNAVIRRSVLESVGPYSTALSHTGTHLLMGEDDDMYRRLLRAGARGWYLPDLIIYHYVPPERLTKRYHRRWSFWRGASQGVRGRSTRQPVAHLVGIPRYRIGNAARGVLKTAAGLVRGGRSSADRFADELAIWDVLGYAFGRYLYRLPS